MAICYFCGTDNPGKAYRTSQCISCGKDLKICLACEFYDKSSHNECREPQAERVEDKAKANFCDYFAASGRSSAETGKSTDARKQFEDLFS